MAVYVDSPKYPFRGMLMCHMTADSLDELHAMADKIGMLREWFQCPPKAKRPHYDLSRPRRALAVSAGAIEISERENVVYANRLRAEWLAKFDPDALPHAMSIIQKFEK